MSSSSVVYVVVRHSYKIFNSRNFLAIAAIIVSSISSSDLANIPKEDGGSHAKIQGSTDAKPSSLPFACKSEIKKFKCRNGADADKHVRLSQILLCLGNAARAGQALNNDCVGEIQALRKSLMEDYQATPELLADCNADSKKFCPNTKPVAGATIHCLMQHAMTPKKTERISSSCRQRLEELLRMTDISEDWNVDPVLKAKCHQVVWESSCRDAPTNQVMSCLMRLLTTETMGDADSHAMTDDCESALLQIQYFMTRDFSINRGLYEQCREDAKSICGVSENWHSPDDGDSKSNSGPLVLSCLYRNLVDENGSVRKACGDRVREAMRERALLVSLNPELEQECLEDLSDLCSDQTKPGEELKCLQINLEMLNSQSCKESVIKITGMEMKDPSIDPFLWKYCEEFVQKCIDSKSAKDDEGSKNKLSSAQDEEGNDEDVMQCLIRLKHDMKNKKCKGRLDYLQLIQLSHIEFSPKFKSLCQADVIRRCNGIAQLTAVKLVSCLSEHIWNDTLTEQPHRISKPCRKQVKYLTMSKLQLEDSTISQGMYAICKDSVRKLCGDVKPGGGRILECLRTKKDEITDAKCVRALFPLQQSVDQDTALDFFLADQCAFEIKTFCADKILPDGSGDPTLITCLKMNSEKDGFDQEKCGKALHMRLLEQNSDLRLNPRLRKACGEDIPRICPRVPVGEGRILECLKEEFVRVGNRLSASCKAHVEGFLQSAAQTDVRLDYTLYKMCHSEIDLYCRKRLKPEDGKDKGGGDNGKIEECLKELFDQDKLGKDCKVQVTLLIQSTQIDIHVDPILHRACSIDLLKRCEGVLPGDGRLIACLLYEYDREKEGGQPRLSSQCRKLLGVRAALFDLAGKPVPVMESIQDLYVHVKESSHRNYFLVVAMSLLGVIFVFGLFCGRVTKRKEAAKDK